MNLISDLESELALAVLIEKKHSEKISSEDVLPLIRRINTALELAAPKDLAEKTLPLNVKKADNTSH